MADYLAVRNLCAWASACRPHDRQECSCTCHPENRGPGTLPYGMKLLNPSQAADEG